MSRRYFLASDLVRAYLQGDPRAEAVEALLCNEEKGGPEMWISGAAVIAGLRDDGRGVGPGASVRLARLLALCPVVYPGRKDLAVALDGSDSEMIVQVEERLSATVPSVTILALDPEPWRRRGRPVMDPAGALGSPPVGKIPLVDLARQLASIYDEVQEAIWRVASSSAFILGEEVRLFEEEFAAYCGALHAVALNSGTDAIHLALQAMGIGGGDGVLTVSHTFIATAEAIAMTGARPIFVEIDPRDYCMAPDAVADFLQGRAVRDGDACRDRVTGLRLRALLPVHIYGQPADMDRLSAIAREYGLHVLEDAAQAHGAAICRSGEWRRAGSLGDAAAFSFYPGKNLGAWGDAGALVTSDAGLAAHVRKLRDHGRTEKYTHEFLGWSSRMDALQAAILRVKLRHLSRWTEARREAAARYAGLLQGCPRLTLPSERAGARHVYHLYVVRVPAPRRKAIQDHLSRAGIQTGVHYPVPLHRQPAFAALIHETGSLQTTEAVAGEVLSLPLYPEITAAEQERVAKALLEALVQ